MFGRGNIHGGDVRHLAEALSANVDARCILDFTKESGFYRAI